jgi:hypothetical protein
MHIDATTGHLYWWNKPDGKVLGAVSLIDCILTPMPAPEWCFRLSKGTKFRDFRADSNQNFETWVRHLNDEIAARSSADHTVKSPPKSGTLTGTLGRSNTALMGSPDMSR